MRTVLTTLLLSCLAPVGVRAQTATDWLDQWARGQRAALADIRSVSLTEHGSTTLESAHGARRIESTVRFTYVDGPEPPRREITSMMFDGKPVDPPTPERRRRYENPMTEVMQPAVDMLLFPTHLLRLMAPPAEGDVETVTFDERSLVSVRTRVEHPGPGVARAIWWFDPDDGRLVQARAFVQGEEGGALEAFVRYERIDGVDLPVRKRVEGSFPVQRRMRTFTVLVDSRSDIDEHRLNRGR